MKKIILLPALCATLLVGCTSKETKENEALKQDLTAANDSLQQALIRQDSLLNLINDVTTDLRTIREMEGILTVNNGDNMPRSQRNKINEDMRSLQTTLQQRRERLEELEKQLQNAKGNAAEISRLKSTIDNLRFQIEENEATIRSLTSQLQEQKIIIEEQAEHIDSLTTTLGYVNDAKQEAEERNVQLTDELNYCYYVVGTNKELKDNNLIQKKNIFSRTKVLPGDVDEAFFTRADKRSLLEINCHSKKAQVMTDQPADSYEFIKENNGDKILVIKNPDEFWKKSSFLIIKID